MGLYTIPCRQCGTMFLWFSGSPIQLCQKCDPDQKDNTHACMRPEQRAVSSGHCPCCGRCQQCGDLRPHYHEGHSVVFTDLGTLRHSDGSLAGFLFETCTNCGRRKKFPGPMLYTGACECENETNEGTSS